MGNKLTAILILGENRNGTTWLANTLYEQFDIIMPYHPLHFGLIETSLYSINHEFQKLKSEQDQKEFIQSYFRSDVFNILEGDTQAFANRNFTNYYEFLIELLAQQAFKQNKKAFAIKLEPRIFSHENDLNTFLQILNSKEIIVKPICIKRNFKDYFISAKSLFKKTQNKNKVHNISAVSTKIITARYKYYYNKFTSFINKKDGLLIDFEAFKTNHKKSIERLKDYLGLEYSVDSENIAAVKNSSGDKELKRINMIDQVLIFLIKTIPFADSLIIKFLEIYKNKSNSSKYIYYRIDRSKNDREALIEEFQNSFEEKLLSQLESES